MKYISLNNQPNVSGTRFQSISPSLRIETDREYPHLAWLDQGNDINIVNYSFWDGLKWSFYNIPKVYVSQEDIVFSPHSLVLDYNQKPSIIFSRKAGSGYRLSIATYDTEWSFNHLDVNYEVGWVGILNLNVLYNNSSSSSSLSLSTSSSSSILGIDHYAVVYDVTNSLFKVYAVNSAVWTLIGSKSATVNDFSSVKIDMCGRKIGIGFVYDSYAIQYNFISIDDGTWAFLNFRNISASQLYGDILDMDLSGYYDSSSLMEFAWISQSRPVGPHATSIFYVNSILCYENGTETPLDGISPVIESSNKDVDTDYIVNGYKKIGICLESKEEPWIIAAGLKFKIFTYTGSWAGEFIDIEGVSSGIVPLYLKIDYSSNTKMSMALDSGDIYYFEPISGGFSISTPDMIIANPYWSYRSDFSVGILDGIDLPDTYGNLSGGILKDKGRPLYITANTSVPPTTTTTTLP